MRHARTRILFVVLALAALFSETAFAVESETSLAVESVNRATAERERLQSELAAAAEAFEELIERQALAEEELGSLQDRVADLEAEAARTSEVLTMRARTAFKHGDGSLLTTLLSAEGPVGALERAQLLSALTARDRGRLEGAQNLRIQLEQARRLSADKASELEALSAQRAAALSALEGRLEAARDREEELKDRYERQLIITRGLQNGTYACIIAAPYHFRDTWGAPRSGGRRHKGTDVFGRWNAHTYAFTHGRVHRISNSRLGGLGLYLYGDDGVLYYYAHLNGIAQGIGVGSRVEAGQLIAYNGDTGNAKGGSPHIHFQVHPGGGSPVNPYPWLAPACF